MKLILPILSILLISCEAIESEPDPHAIYIPSDVKTFALQEQLPDAQPVRGRYFSDDPYILLFSVSYGPPMDCPAGCFYAGINGIKTESGIGWMLDEDYLGDLVNLENRYSIDENEPALFDTSQYMYIKESEWGASWYRNILSYLAVDVDTPSYVLEYIALSLYDYISPSLTIDLLSNLKLDSEPKVLCIMAANPLSGNQGSEAAIRDSISTYGIDCSDY